MTPQPKILTPEQTEQLLLRVLREGEVHRSAVSADEYAYAQRADSALFIKDGGYLRLASPFDLSTNTLEAWVRRLPDPERRLYLCDVVEQVLPIYEHTRPLDPWPRQDLRTARQFATGAVRYVGPSQPCRTGRKVAFAASNASSTQAEDESWQRGKQGRAAYFALSAISAVSSLYTLKDVLPLVNRATLKFGRRERTWRLQRFRLYLNPLLTLGEAALQTQAWNLFPLEGERAHVALAHYERLVALTPIRDQSGEKAEAVRGKILSKTHAREFTELGYHPERGFVWCGER